MFKNAQEYIEQKKESFRTEIRRQDREKVFNQKRLQMKQQQNTSIKIEQLIPEIQKMTIEQNYQELKQLHILAFNLLGSQTNQLYLLKNNYLLHSLPSLQIPEVQVEVIRTLANSCNHPEFQSQPTELIVQTLQVSYQLVNTLTNEKDISDILVYLGNVASKSIQISKLLSPILIRLLELSNNSDVNLYRNVCFCMHNITLMLDDQGLSIAERIIGLKILENGVKRDDCDLLQNEILHPLSVLYSQSQEIDQFLLKSNLVKFVVSSQNGEFIQVTLQVIKQFSLTESIELSNLLLDLNVLDLALEFSNNRNKQIKKFVFLIIINLSFTDSKIANRIIQHNILGRVINGLITHVQQEASYCMQIILNLQKSGDNAVYQKLLESGIISIIENLLLEVDSTTQRFFLDSISRFLSFAKEQEDKKIQDDIIKLQPKFDKLYQDNQDARYLELYNTFMKLI